MKTILYNTHQSLAAKMITFAGWELPLFYKGTLIEHQAVRQAAGIFDISHMGRISIEGEEAELFLDYLSTNEIRGQPKSKAIYTVWADQEGGSVDDVIIYKIDETHFFVIVNGCNRAKDLAHLKEQGLAFKVSIRDFYREEGILALQGPLALLICAKIFPEVLTLKPMHFLKTTFKDCSLFISATGYTGAGGVEIYAPLEILLELWTLLLKEGTPLGLQACGLGARDSLRLEMGFALYGHELSKQIAANESVSHWTIKWHKKNFLGKQALQALQQSPKKRTQYGVKLMEQGIMREGYAIFKEDHLIGHLTSGSYSPTLNCSIGILLTAMNLTENELVEVEIRQKRLKAKISSLPFIKKQSSL